MGTSMVRHLHTGNSLDCKILTISFVILLVDDLFAPGWLHRLLIRRNDSA